MKDHWTSPGFLSAAQAWVDEQLARAEQVRTGELEQPHVTEWSTAIRFPTSAGLMWFKATHGPLRHEAALTELVARRSGGRVPAPLAVHSEAGWMLTADAGRRLREVVARDRSLVRWHDALQSCARVQIACEPDVPALLELGAPDLRLATLASAYAALLGGLELPADLAQRLPDEDRVAALCAELAAYGVPETLQHDDLHDGQVFLGPDEDQHLLLDWGDACVSHPFFTLSVALEGVIAWGVDDVPASEQTGSYRAAYLEPYRERFPELDLEEVARRAQRLGWICRAVNGHLQRDPDSTLTRLRMYVDGAG